MPNNRITVIIGRKGCGKTYLAKHLCKDKKSLAVFDPGDNFSDCGLVIGNPYDLAVYTKQQKDKNFRIIYQPEGVNIGSKKDIIEESFDFFLRNVANLLYVCVVVDEIHLVASQKSNNFLLRNFSNMGRKPEISMIVTSIRYTDVIVPMRANADEFISFQAEEPADVDYLRKKWGTIADELESLPPYHFIRKRSDQLKATKERPV